MAEVRLVAELPPRETDALRVHHDDEITGIDVGRECRRVLPAQHRRDAGCEPSQHLPFGVGDEPAPSGPGGLGGKATRGVGDRHLHCCEREVLIGIVEVLTALRKMTGPTRLELATSGVTGRRSNQLNYDPVLPGQERR